MKSKIHGHKKSSLLFLMLLLCGTVYAQENQLRLYFQTEGMRIIADYGGGDGGLDADGDGVPDLILTRRDGQNRLIEILGIEAKTTSEKWRIEDVRATLGLGDEAEFYGFADPFGSRQPHAVFTEPTDVHLVSFDGATEAVVVWSHSIFSGREVPPPVALIAVLDLTGDFIPDLLIQEVAEVLEMTRLQVWSIDP